MRKAKVVIGCVVAMMFIASPPAAQAAGFCDGPNKFQLIFIRKEIADTPGGYFDYVRGETTVRDLDVCTNTALAQGGTFILPANVETDSGFALQLGYGQNSGSASERFWYAHGNPPQAFSWPATKNYLPIQNHVYRFEIWPSGGDRNYRLTDLTPSPDTTSQLSLEGPWYTTLDRTWWGGETWDTASAMGAHAGDPTTIVRYMGYSWNGDGSILYRSGLAAGDVNRLGNPTTNKHGHITNWVYGNDALHLETH